MLVWRRILVALGTLGALACSRVQPPVEQVASPANLGASDVEAPPQGRLSNRVRPSRYRLTLEVVPTRGVFEGLASIDIELEERTSAFYLHAQNLRTKSVVVLRQSTGANSPALIAAKLVSVGATGLVRLEATEPLDRGPATIEISYEADFNAHLRGLYRVESAGEAYAFTQFEPISARSAFPCFDEPRFKTPFEVTLRVPKDAVAIANTREVGSKVLPTGLKELQFAPTEPLPTYLVALAVGPFDVVEAPRLPGLTSGGPGVPFRGVAPRGEGKHLAFALDETPALLSSLEKYFGVAYPYDKLDLIAVPDFVAGAMENAGAITFRDSLLLVKKDAPERQRRACVGVNAHELAHQWFGNLVTMAWWDDLWLNEAFATWMGGRVTDEIHPEYDTGPDRVAWIDRAMQVDSKLSARQIRQPIESEHDISNAFDTITYSKGGAVIGMFERYLGAERFRSGLKLYLERHRFGTATTEDLLDALGDASGEPVGEAFTTFLTQPGVPLISFEVRCTRSAPPRVHLEQKRYLPLGARESRDQLWQVPVCLRYGVADVGAKQARSREQCLLLREREADIALDTPTCPKFVVPNAGGTGYYRWLLGGQDLGALLGAGLAELSVEERLSVIANVAAGVQAGALPLTQLFSAIERVTRSDRRELLQAALDALSYLREATLSDAELPAYRARVKALLSPSLREVGIFAPSATIETGQKRLLRAAVVGALAMEAWDGTLRRELLSLGRAQLGLERNARLAALPSELIETALGVAIQEGGAASMARAVELLRQSNDGLERGRLLSALGANRNPQLSPFVLELSLNPALRGNEVLSPVLNQARHRETREATYSWMAEHYAELVARAGPENAAGLVQVTGGFCSEEAAERAEKFFAPKIGEITGGPRNLMLTLETIRLCAAFAKTYREEARTLFAKEVPH